MSQCTQCIGVGEVNVDVCTLLLFHSRPEVGDVFIGYHADTAASVILQVSQSHNTEDELPAEQVTSFLHPRLT